MLIYGSMKPDSYHDANFVVIGGVADCHVMIISGVTSDYKIDIF